MKSWGWSSDGWDCYPYRIGPREPICPSCEDRGECQLWAREWPPDTESAGALLLNFLVCRPVRSERLLFINCPGAGILSRQFERTETPPQVAAASPETVRGTKIGVHLALVYAPALCGSLQGDRRWRCSSCSRTEWQAESCSCTDIRHPSNFFQTLVWYSGGVAQPQKQGHCSFSSLKKKKPCLLRAI